MSRRPHNQRGRHRHGRTKPNSPRERSEPMPNPRLNWGKASLDERAAQKRREAESREWLERFGPASRPTLD